MKLLLVLVSGHVTTPESTWPGRSQRTTLSGIVVILRNEIVWKRNRPRDRSSSLPRTMKVYYLKCECYGKPVLPVAWPAALSCADVIAANPPCRRPPKPIQPAFWIRRNWGTASQYLKASADLVFGNETSWPWQQTVENQPKPWLKYKVVNNFTNKHVRRFIVAKTTYCPNSFSIFNYCI